MAGCTLSVLPVVTSPVALSFDPSAEVRFVKPEFAACRQRSHVLVLLSMGRQATGYWQLQVKDTCSNADSSTQGICKAGRTCWTLS